MSMAEPIVTAQEMFDVDRKVRWVALATDRGEVLLNQVKPGVNSYSPSDADREFVSLGPLTILGVCERYSGYLKGVDYVVVWFGLVICVYARLGSQVMAVSIEKDREALMNFLDWLEVKQKRIAWST